MANEKITDYTEKVTIADDDLFEIVDSVAGDNKKTKYSTLRAVLQQLSDIIIASSDPPFGAFHIKTEDRGFDASFIDLGVGIAYPLIIEAQDAMVALVSEAEGSHGSGINLMEVDAGALDHAWTLLTKTSLDAQAQIFEIIGGTNKAYNLNPQRFLITLDGKNSAIGTIETFDKSFRDANDNFAVCGGDARIRVVSLDVGTWGSGITFDQMDASEATDFENIWALIRQTNGDGDGDGRLSFTYGTDTDPANNTELAKLTQAGIFESNGMGLKELSADPGDPAEGKSVMWQSDGTGSGDDGDIMMKITAGATTKTTTLVDFSAI